MNRKIPLFALIVYLLVVVGQTSATVPQATIVVNSANDVSDVTDGLCTLREAMLAANQNVESGVVDDECVAGDDGDTITFDLPAGTTIELTGNALTFSDTVTIDGLGSADLTIDAMGLNRVVHVTAGTSVTITGVTLQGGAKPANFDDGGGIFSFNGAGVLNEGTLLLNDVVVRDNALTEGDGAGIHAVSRDSEETARTTILNSLITDNHAINSGGGIFNRDGFMTIENSIISNNSAGGNGGGVLSSTSMARVVDAVTITSSRIISNEAGANGGGMHISMLGGGFALLSSEVAENTAGTNGGAMYAHNAELSIMNSTIHENTAAQGGGLYLNLLLGAEMHGNTIYNNIGGGIFSNALSPHFALYNTIVAHDVNVDGDDCDLAASLSDGQGSLDSDGSCDVAYSGDPKLAPPTPNSAGFTFYAPQPGSPAIGRGYVTICKLNGKDINGTERPIGFLCDIGAIESDTMEGGVFLPLLTTQN